MSILLSAQGLTKGFGHRSLFVDLSLDLRENEHIGLIGPNGAGKSTLLKVLAGLEAVEAGTLALRRNCRLAYVRQDDVFEPGLEVLEVVLQALEDEPLEDYERDTQAASALSRAGFTDFRQQASTLSGGWRKRLALARALALQPHLVLLDEPTNHLDLPGILWLERLLKEAPFAFVAATHDRAFLRAIASEIVELSRIYPAGYFRTPGPYESFADQREAFLEAQQRRQEAVANQVRRETEWLGRKESAQRRKSSARLQDAAERREELAELNFRNAAAGQAKIDFVGTGRQTRKLLTGTGLEKSLADRLLFRNLDVRLAPGVKLGLLGPNGSGKSTLLRILAGQLSPDAGSLVRGDDLRLVHFEQGRTSLNLEQTLRRALCPNGDTVVFNERPTHVTAWAKRFLFQPEQLEVPVRDLSGGEQARVRLAQLMLQPADLLLLDEPTNDLDIPAVEVLEDTLAEFPGALVLVSHDRDLMDRLCTEVIGLDGRGGSGLYGSVDQWLAALAKAEAPPSAPAEKAGTSRRPATVKPKKLSYREQQEWDNMEATILTAEERLAGCRAEVERAANLGHTVLAQACKALEEAQHAVDAVYARWQELEEKRANLG